MVAFNSSNSANTNTSYVLSFPFIINTAFGLTGCALNGCVCLIIGCHKALRQPFNHLILNLSLSDFVVSLAVIIYGLSNYAYTITIPILDPSPFALSDILCKLDVFCIVSSLTATCLTLFIISIERYQAVTVLRLQSMELSTARKIIFMVWILASLSAAIPASFAQIDEALFYNCHIGRINNFVLIVISVILLSLNCILPAVLMLFLYGIITCKLYIDRHVSVSTLELPVTVFHRKKTVRRSILAVLFISVISAGTGIPYLIFSIIVIVGHYYDPSFKPSYIRQNKLAWDICTYLFILTPILNPVLYNLASNQFRKVLKQLLCRYHCAFIKTNTPLAIRLPIHDTDGLKTLTTKTSQQLAAVD